MKLKSDFIVQDVDDAQFLVPVGQASFSGIVRSNATAAFIVNCLREETTVEQIVDAMCETFDAPRATIAADVEKSLATLRKIGALEE